MNEDCEDVGHKDSEVRKRAMGQRGVCLSFCSLSFSFRGARARISAGVGSQAA